jgi:hypothetical protein
MTLPTRRKNRNLQVQRGAVVLPDDSWSYMAFLWACEDKGMMAVIEVKPARARVSRGSEAGSGNQRTEIMIETKT